MSGWYWCPVKLLNWYLVGLLGILMQWRILGKRCLLTDLEWWLRYRTKWEPDVSAGFLAVWADRLGVPWTPRANEILPYICMYLFIGIAIARIVSQS